jgi:hypothetical protein
MARPEKKQAKKPRSSKHTKKAPAWRRFEREIENIYRDLGAINVVHDTNMDGNQIDVYVEIPLLDGTFERRIISCKHFDSAAGVESVREWNAVFQSLSHSGKVDVGSIVSATGFSQDANALARTTGIKLITIDQLRLASYDFVPYVKGQLAEFEAERVFDENLYIPTRVCRDGRREVLGSDVFG